MIDIPQELREMRGEDDSNSRSNAQANAIKVTKRIEGLDVLIGSFVIESKLKAHATLSCLRYFFSCLWNMIVGVLVPELS